MSPPNPNPNPKRVKRRRRGANWTTNKKRKTQQKVDQEQPRWAELNGDILLVIFRMVGTIDVLKSAGSVCRAWRKVAKDEPELWRRIAVTNHNYVHNLTNLARMAIDRSGDRLEEFWIGCLGDDNLLQYLCDRSSVLKSLRLIWCYNISVEGVVEAVKRQPLLEELQIKFGTFSYELPELVGEQLPNLKQFKWCSSSSNFNMKEDNDVAFGIARTMHELRYLQLIFNRMTNEGLKAILEGCPHLEKLDIRGCNNVKMDSDMRAQCARLSTLMLPDDY